MTGRLPPNGTIVIVIALSLAGVVASQSCADDEFTVLRIPLEQNQYYNPRDVQTALCPNCPISPTGQQRAELTLGMKAALLLLAKAFPDALKVHFEPNCLVLEIANSKAPDVRRRARERALKIFGIHSISTGEWGLKRPDPVDARQQSIILVHGLEASGASMEAMQQAFKAWGVQTFLFVYPNDNQIDTAGSRLRRDLVALSRSYPALRVVIVAYSMGGLVARYSLEVEPLPPACVTDLFTLGTPHRGSCMAVGQPWLELIDMPNPLKMLDPRSGMRDGLGQAAEQLLPDSEFLKELNQRPRPTGIRYHVAAGRHGFLSLQRRRALLEALEEHQEGDHARKAAVMQLITAPELQTGRGDGAVTLESALLPGADTHRVFDLNHMELIHPKTTKPEQSEVFRWIVDTLDWGYCDAGTEIAR